MGTFTCFLQKKYFIKKIIIFVSSNYALLKMEDIIEFEKKYGYIVAVVVTIISAVLIKYGYDDQELVSPIIGEKPVMTITTKGKIMIGLGVLMIAAAWGAALSYAK